MRFSFLVLLLLASAFRPAAAPVISEFMASNQSTLLDEDGEPSDWIEIHNPDATAVDLKDWSLTDDPALPAKWRFPVLRLEPGDYLVVFASGKDRSGPGPLHTNFRLEVNGEYLGLFPPEGGPPSAEFRPAFPPQETDVAYGNPAAGSTRDLLADARIAVLVPTAATALDDAWTSPDLPVGPPWQILQGPGVGFDATPASPGAGVNLAAQGTAQQSTTGFGFGADVAIDGDPDSFTHTASNDNASAWWVDLGASYEIGRITLRNRTSCCQSRLRDITVTLLAADGETIAWQSDLLNPENELGSPPEITLDLFDLNLGPVVARIVHVSRTPDPDLSGSGGSGNEDEDNVLSLGEVEVFGVDALSFAGLIRSDLAASMVGRNASAFLRIPFVLEDPTALRSLGLTLRYDDGIALYLNGQTVLSYNTPSPLAWNSVAVSHRDKADALEPASINLEPFRSLWRTGTNWLAAQVLNAALNDPDLLFHASLHAGTDVQPPPAFLDRPTPGGPNVAQWNFGRVADTRFSVQRGHFETPFDLEITSNTPGAEIRYTLDGTPPSPSHGAVYSAPIHISRTTIVRAAAFKADYRPTNIDTHSFLFLADVVTQPANPAGFPSNWAGVSADYATDPRIATHPDYGPRFIAALQSLPSLSLVLDLDDFFGATRGIYANPERSGVSWERPTSLEWFNADGTDTFQVDAGLRIQGGYFRQRSVTRKHSLRLLFKDEYGPGRLRRDLFHEFGAAREFDTLVLRAGANDGYSWDAARDTEQFLRDEFGRRLHLAMGHPSPRGNFVHLFLNGLYWGLYNLTERPAEDFSASYLGGAPEDWDAINSGEVKSGSLTTWNTFVSATRAATTLADYQRLKGLRPDGTRDLSLPVYLDAPNYIDYMLLNIWGGNWDWPNKNFWFGRNQTGESGGFRFYIWDFENTMGNNRGRSPLDMVAPRSGIESSWVAEPHDRLKRLAEYRLEFADRVHRHCIQNGVLAPESLVARYRALADHTELAVIAETARWGDDHHNPPQDLADWLRERDWILGTYLPQRTGVVLDQLRAQGLYPRTAAPVAVPDGGAITLSTPITLRVAASELFYTTNGLDPRLPGGGIAPSAVRVTFNQGQPTTDPNLVQSGHAWRYLDDGSDPGSEWRQPAFDDAAWPSGPSPLGYGDNDEATVVGYIDTDPAQAGTQRNATTYFRTEFTAESPSAFSSLTLTFTYDDAGAVFLNGTEILRTANLPSDARFNTYATDQSPDNANVTVRDLPISLLRPGRNVIAAEVHQRDATSSDISFDLQLLGFVPDLGGSNISEPFFLTHNTLLRARARQGDEWSALAEIVYSLESVPASSNNLVISQFCFRPPEPVSANERAVSVNRDDYEYLELLNIGPQAVSLDGVRLTAGVLFDFPVGRWLAPGARAILVSHLDAFKTRYGNNLPVEGQYDGRLDNAGEEIALVDAGGQDLRRFTFNDHPPWPTLPNSTGHALVLIRPQENPDHRDPLQWRSSLLAGGSPGASDASTFTGNPSADVDGNGQSDILDYALGLAPGAVAAPIEIDVETVETATSTTHHLRITFSRNPTADDAPIVVETAEHLAGPWRGGPALFDLVGEERTAGSTTRLTYRLLEPLDARQSVFVRLNVVF